MRAPVTERRLAKQQAAARKHSRKANKRQAAIPRAVSASVRRKNASFEQRFLAGSRQSGRQRSNKPAREHAPKRRTLREKESSPPEAGEAVDAEPDQPLQEVLLRDLEHKRDTS